jgi:hypothetical protein
MREENSEASARVFQEERQSLLLSGNPAAKRDKNI